MYAAGCRFSHMYICTSHYHIRKILVPKVISKNPYCKSISAEVSTHLQRISPQNLYSHSCNWGLLHTTGNVLGMARRLYLVIRQTGVTNEQTPKTQDTHARRAVLERYLSLHTAALCNSLIRHSKNRYKNFVDKS